MVKSLFGSFASVVLQPHQDTRMRRQTSPDKPRADLQAGRTSKPPNRVPISTEGLRDMRTDLRAIWRTCAARKQRRSKLIRPRALHR